MYRILKSWSVLLLVGALGACGAGTDAPQDPLKGFMAKGPGAACARDSDCASGFCDRYLFIAGRNEDQPGSCSSFFLAALPWQRHLLLERLSVTIGGDDSLRRRVLELSADILDNDEIPPPLRAAALELASSQLSEPDPDWTARLTLLVRDSDLAEERLSAMLVLLRWQPDGPWLARVVDLLDRADARLKVRAARNLAGLCRDDLLSVTAANLAEDNRFIRHAVLHGLAACEPAYREPLLEAFLDRCMPYERILALRFLQVF